MIDRCYQINGWNFDCFLISHLFGSVRQNSGTYFTKIRTIDENII